MGRQEEDLKEKGIRLTWRRQAILEVFRATDQHLSADDVLAELRQRQARINATTVYRNLEMLTRQGVLRHVDFHDGRCRYEWNEGPCHHHLHCTSCGRVVEFGRCELGRLEGALAKRTNFVIQRHQLEIYGLCPDCR